MPAELFTVPAKHKRVNPVVRKSTRTHVSKDEWAGTVARRREASHKYKASLDETWTQMDKTIESLATQHHKSIKQVRQELHFGRSFAHGKHAKNSDWNAFMWKKEQDRKTDESKPFIFFSEMSAITSRNRCLSLSWKEISPPCISRVRW